MFLCDIILHIETKWRRGIATWILLPPGDLHHFSDTHPSLHTGNATRWWISPCVEIACVCIGSNQNMKGIDHSFLLVGQALWCKELSVFYKIMKVRRLRCDPFCLRTENKDLCLVCQLENKLCVSTWRSSVIRSLQFTYVKYYPAKFSLITTTALNTGPWIEKCGNLFTPVDHAVCPRSVKYTQIILKTNLVRPPILVNSSNTFVIPRILPCTVFCKK